MFIARNECLPALQRIRVNTKIAIFYLIISQDYFKKFILKKQFIQFHYLYDKFCTFVNIFNITSRLKA